MVRLTFSFLNYFLFQGNFLSLNSDDSTMARNSGIFWAMSISSSFIGNIFVFFMFSRSGTEYIDEATRNTVGIVLLCVTVAGTCLMFFLRPTPWAESTTSAKGPLEALKDSAKLFVTKDMLLLSVTFYYTGVQLNIWSSVYGTSIGYTNAFGKEAKDLTAMSGIFVALGEVLGGALFGIFGSLTVKRGRDPIVLLGFILSMVAYFLAFLNLPNSSPLGATDDKAFIGKYWNISSFHFIKKFFQTRCLYFYSANQKTVNKQPLISF